LKQDGADLGALLAEIFPRSSDYERGPIEADKCVMVAKAEELISALI
jgi:hypothetical protein